MNENIDEEYFDKQGVKHIIFIKPKKIKESMICTCYLSRIDDMQTVDKNGLCIACRKERKVDLDRGNNEVRG